MKRVEADGNVEVDRYRIVNAAVAKKDDVRRNDEEPAIRVVNLEVALERATIPVKAGDYYVPLDQPLGNVVVAALEPDSQSSYAANYVLTYPGPRDPERVRAGVPASGSARAADDALEPAVAKHATTLYYGRAALLALAFPFPLPMMPSPPPWPRRARSMSRYFQ